MAIWKKNLTVEEINAMCEPTVHTPLGIAYTEITDEGLRGQMPVDERTHQPFGFLHGGASALLAESLGSMAAYLASGPDETPLGIEINANHLAAVTSGIVTGIARPTMIGRTLHVWSIEIHDARGRLVCVSRLTVMIRSKQAPST